MSEQSPLGRGAGVEDIFCVEVPSQEDHVKDPVLFQKDNDTNISNEYNNEMKS